MNSPRQDEGFVLIIAIMALLASAIFLPALFFMINNESRWSVKEKKVTIAFHMAEQGLDRGVWKMQESDAVWDAVSTGTIVPGYNGDVVYTSTYTVHDATMSDGRAGQYKIKLGSGSVAGRVKVRAVGRDISTDEVRCIEVEYTKQPVDAGMQIRGGINYKSGLKVHWGPVITYTSIDQTPGADQWPRKISKGQIVGRDDSANLPNGDDGTWPNPGVYDYASFVTDLGNPPTIALDSYRKMAKESSIPSLRKSGGTGAACSDTQTAVAEPRGSGYFVSTAPVELATPCDTSYLFNSATSVIFVESSAAIGNRTNDGIQIKVRAFVTMGGLTVNGDADDPSYIAKIPPEARVEYYFGNGVTKWTNDWSGACPVQPCTGYYKVPNAIMIGYVYVGKDLSNSGGSNLNIVGVVDSGTAGNPNNLNIYYDAFVSTGIMTMNQKPRKLYWRETLTAWDGF